MRAIAGSTQLRVVAEEVLKPVLLMPEGVLHAEVEASVDLGHLLSKTGDPLRSGLTHDAGDAGLADADLYLLFGDTAKHFLLKLPGKALGKLGYQFYVFHEKG